MPTLRSRRGTSLIEVVMVITLIGLMAAILVPRLRVSATTKTRHAADQLVRDLELVRTRAMSTRAATRVVFTTGSRSYTAYMDWDRNGVFGLTTAESDSVGGFRNRVLQDNVVYGRGATPDIPSIPGGGNITFTGSAITFDARGLTTPFGARGVVYLTHPTDPTALSAVSVTPGGAIRRWVYRSGAWQ
jgi:Tfp pilus assembly protein FimT